MYYDLNILWPYRPAVVSSTSSSSTTKKQAKGKQREAVSEKRGIDTLSEVDATELRSCVQMAIKLGYSTIAFNVVLPPGTFNVSTVAALNPCFLAKPLFPELDPRTADTGKAKKTVLQLSRLTVLLDESSLNGGKGNGSLFTSGNANSLAGYSLLSALPLDQAAFTQVCLNYTNPGPSSVDIITLDLATSARLPFQLKRSMVLKALSEGAVFEVCYGLAMRSNSDTHSSMIEKPIPKEARRNVVAGARELIRVTNGKGIILSSEVRRCMEMRAALDLCNFGTILGLKPDQAKNAVSGNSRMAVIRGYASRGTYRGVISNPEVLITTKSDRKDQPGAKRKRVEEDEAGQD